LYEQIADDGLGFTEHLAALVGYQQAGRSDEAFAVVLRLARLRPWPNSPPTQVRPMEFFLHPALFSYLRDSDSIRAIAQAATGGKR